MAVDQGSNTTNTTPGAQGANGANGATTTTTAGPSVEELSRAIEASTSALKAAQAKLDTLEKDNASYRERERQRKAGDDDAKKKAGEFEPLLQEREKTIAELTKRMSELEPSAKAWAEYETAEKQAIAEAAKTLPEADRKLLDSVSGLRAQRQLLERLNAGSVKDGNTTDKKERPKSPPDVNPGPNGSTIEQRLAAGESPSAIARTDPKGWDAYAATIGNGAKPKPWSGLFKSA